MTTLYIEGIDEEIVTQLEAEAKRFNTGINELVKQFIYQGLNTYKVKNTHTIDSLFGMMTSSTDGLEFQKVMREG